MAKIIERGESHRIPTYQITCSDCKSLIEYNLKDVRTNKRGLRNVGPYVECPVCTRYMDWDIIEKYGRIVG